MQGPPGSGKTYTAARLIVELVGAGRKVGITANSHATISNLVKAVLAEATEAGRRVRVAQKADADQVVEPRRRGSRSAGYPPAGRRPRRRAR